MFQNFSYRMKKVTLMYLLTGFLTSLSFYIFGILLQYFFMLIGYTDKISLKIPFELDEYYILAIFFLSILFQGICQFLQIYINRIFNETYIFESRKNFFNLFFKENSSWNLDLSSTSNIMAEIIPKSASYVGGKVRIITLLIQIAFISLFCLYENYLYFFYILLSLLTLYPFIYFYKLKFKKLSKHILELSLTFNKNLIRSIKNYPFIKISSLEKKEKHFLNNSAENYFKKFKKSMYYLSINSSFPQTLGSIIVIFFFYQFSKTNTENLLVLFYLLYRFINTLSQLIASYQNLNVYASHYKAMKKINFGSILINNNNLKKKYFSKINKFEYLLKLNNLNINFKDNFKVIRDLSLSLSKSESMLIKGPSGSGKSTILLALLGIIQSEHNQKSIYWKDVDIDELDIEDLRSSTSFVGAEPFIISGSIKENLLFGINSKDINSISDNDIYEVCKIANAENFILEKNERLDFIINEYGEGLSMGQKQRLCLARALLRKPKMLLLDEVTANLDNETEKLIAISLNKIKKNINIIITSHSNIFDNMFEKKIVLQ